MNNFYQHPLPNKVLGEENLNYGKIMGLMQFIFSWHLIYKSLNTNEVRGTLCSILCIEI